MHIGASIFTTHISLPTYCVSRWGTCPNPIDSRYAFPHKWLCPVTCARTSPLTVSSSSNGTFGVDRGVGAVVLAAAVQANDISTTMDSSECMIRASDMKNR